MCGRFATNSNSSDLIFKLFRSRLHTSLKHNFGRPRLRLPTTNLPYNRDFGIRSALILRTWPSQRSLRWLRVKYIVVRLVRLNTSSLVVFYCHAILRIRQGRRRWNLLFFFSCTLDNVHVSLQYSRVLYTQEP